MVRDSGCGIMIGLWRYMEKIIKIFEKWIVLTLLGLMMLAVLVSTVELAVILKTALCWTSVQITASLLHMPPK